MKRKIFTQQWIRTWCQMLKHNKCGSICLTEFNLRKYKIAQNSHESFFSTIYTEKSFGQREMGKEVHTFQPFFRISFHIYLHSDSFITKDDSKNWLNYSDMCNIYILKNFNYLLEFFLKLGNLLYEKKSKNWLKCRYVGQRSVQSQLQKKNVNGICQIAWTFETVRMCKEILLLREKYWIFIPLFLWFTRFSRWSKYGSILFISF